MRCSWLLAISALPLAASQPLPGNWIPTEKRKTERRPSIECPDPPLIPGSRAWAGEQGRHQRFLYSFALLPSDPMIVRLSFSSAVVVEQVTTHTAEAFPAHTLHPHAPAPTRRHIHLRRSRAARASPKFAT
jgi:hypothetical protein